MGRRYIWLLMCGILISIWSIATFRNVVALWGSMVKADEITTKPTSFDSARILIETDLMTLIDEKVILVLNGSVCPIQIRQIRESVEGLGISDEKVGLVNRIEDEDDNTIGDVMQMVASDEPLDHVGPLVPVDGPRETSLKPRSMAITIYYNGLERKTREVANLVTKLDPQDFISRKKAILKEAEETVALGKLVGAVTIGNESDIIRGIPSIIKESKLEDVSAVMVKHARQYAIINVYAPCVIEEQRQLWLELSDFIVNLDSSHCICGDFNNVRSLEE
ncbi:hypothetical protein V6N12_009259 [Hibiscus sabdariffa]|uniref:Uncharacterized protein n=1 Tax=Hibiscus sabdariffa TaxID=183260 RepID=A0ABR2BIV1_9ROSI